jgi:hypothetical protein
MAINCKNCNHQFEGHFCNNCGQTANTHKMNFHFVWHDIQHGLLHFDKGILFSIKELFTRPGHSIREFIDGKRVSHFKPISLIIVLATVYGILYHYFHINLLKTGMTGGIIEGWNNANKIGETPLDISKINEWFATHYSWTALLLLPFYALGSFLAFRKSDYNYIEHLILNAFLTGQRLLVHIIFLPLLYLYNETTTLAKISSIIDIVCFALLIWAYIQFFNHYSKVKVFILTLLSYIFIGVSLLLCSIIGVLVTGLFFKIFH